MSKKDKAKKKEILTMSADELNTTARQLEEQIFKFKMQHATGQLANTASIKLARKELARAKTALTLKNTKAEKPTQARK